MEKIKNKSLEKGFTLLEMIIVIGIIAIIAAAIVVLLGSARASARDVKRISDIKQIMLALDIYFEDREEYPGPASSYGESETNCAGYDVSSIDTDGDGKAFIEPLVLMGYLQVVPSDPKNEALCDGFAYRYNKYPAGTFGCAASKGAYYIIGINILENVGGEQNLNSPGFSCPEKDFQEDFDWVFGKFEIR